MIGEFLNKQAPYILKSIVIIIITLMISYIFRYIVSKMLKLGKKGQTAAKLIDSFIKYFTAILIILLVLSAFGVPTITLLASVGILGLVIGLSAQSLISDIISGLFIVFEGAYEVGDYIVIEGFRGVVESIGIRTTNFIDYAGNIKIINNSEIKRVINLSKEPSAAEVLIKVSHQDFKKAETAIENELPNIQKRLTMFKKGPDYLGPNQIDELGLQLFFLGYADEGERFAA